MTNTEKQKILELRSKGYGYKKISKELGISVGSIRNICEKGAIIHVCKNCGVEIKSIKGKKQKIYCSDKCRFDWWNKHRDELNHKLIITNISKHCGKEFLSHISKPRIYCSVQCYDAFRTKGGDSDE